MEEFAEKLYASMLYDIVFEALPVMLARFVGSGGFIGAYKVISNAAKRVYAAIAEKMGKPRSIGEAAELMKLMARVHNKFSDGIVAGLPRLKVEIVSDHEVVVVCRGSGYGEGGEHVPVAFMGLVGGFLEALGFAVKPLRSQESIKYLKRGEVGLVVEGDGRECRVRVVSV